MNEDDARAATVRLILAVREQYLASGANPIKHWQQMQDRLRAAARTTDSVPAWATKLARDLHVNGANRRVATALTNLTSVVGAEHGAFLDLVEREHAYLMALARVEAEKRTKGPSA